LLLIFGGIAIAFNLSSRPVDTKMAPLTTLQVVTVFTGYVCTVVAYGLMLYRFMHF
jgi:hypothetical protein